MQTPTQWVNAYRATFYEVRLPDGKRAILRIGQVVPDALCTWTGHDWPLVFLSACNPGSNRLALFENRVRTRALLARLNGTGIRKLIGVGRARDQSWRETSLLISGLSLLAADRLAIEFGQNAILLATESNSTQLRLYREDWRDRIDSEANLVWSGF